MILNKTLYRFLVFTFILGLLPVSRLSGQPVPGKDENIPFLVTFGKDGKTSWGDDDFSQIFFFTIPKDYNRPIYIRVFDPDCGGENDEIQGEFNTRTRVRGVTTASSASGVGTHPPPASVGRITGTPPASRTWSG